MRKELEHFWIGASYGGNQDWLMDPMMRIGGCAALAACDSAIFFDRMYGTEMSACDAKRVTREGYTAFAKQMKPYLRPRWMGVNKTEIFTEGFGRYLRDREVSVLSMTSFPGTGDLRSAVSAIKKQIDQGYLIPYLMLQHRDTYLNREYGWHWFLINGYQEEGGRFSVKAVTYSEWEWIDFEKLWNTGYNEKGGFILYDLQQRA